MNVVRVFVWWVLLVSPVSAQIHVSKPALQKRMTVPAKPSVLKPDNCDEIALRRDQPWLRRVCEQSNYASGTHYARTYGMPGPSAAVMDLPAYGTAEAKRSGTACMGQRAMRRLDNGWEQLRDRDGRYLRCRPR